MHFHDIQQCACVLDIDLNWSEIVIHHTHNSYM